MDEADVSPRTESTGRCWRFRIWSGFWLLGLCNNFAYVIMLSAAHDILQKQASDNSTAPTVDTVRGDFVVGNSSNSSLYDCNPISTAAVLLADILPSLLVKVSAPLFIHKVPYGVRVVFCICATVTSFLLVSFSSSVWLSILGVVFASVGSGLGELSFLSLTVFFSRNVLEGWGSGTGAAGVAGALLYSFLTQLSLSPRVTLQFMLVVPISMLASYFLLLDFPPLFPQWTNRGAESVLRCEVSEERRQMMDESDEEEEHETQEDTPLGPLTVQEKLQVFRGLLRFMFPLGLVYFAEYFINQGLMELLYFPEFFLSHAEQYRWYQTVYQFGVLVSRSSLHCVKIRKLWVLALLQCVNAMVLLLAVCYQFLPNAWCVLAVVLYEGLLGGAAYVNTFHYISKESGDRHREFAMATASAGDSLGIALSTLAAFPAHKYFCSL